MKCIFNFLKIPRNLQVAVFVGVALFLPTHGHGKTVTNSSLEEWLAQETVIAQTKMAANISPVGTARGIIVASPSHRDPDYYFHWIRDSALVIDAAATAADFVDYLRLSKKLQGTPTLTGLGEPRFNIDGTPYSGDWSRPQNDGPALRVLTVLNSKIAVGASAQGEIKPLISEIVETDVEYILAHRNQPCFDLWEEIRGQHFYTRRVQMAALQAALDHYEASWKFSKATLSEASLGLRQQLEQHWIPEKGYFSVTRDRMDGGEKYKFTDLDSAVILAALHSKAQTGRLSIEDDRMMSTASKLEDEFTRVYELNKGTVDSVDAGVAPAIGRYTDDVYFGGNPWYITTAAFAELHYKLAAGLRGGTTLRVSKWNLDFFRKVFSGKVQGPRVLRIGANLTRTPRLRRNLAEALVTRGDQFLARLRLHTPADGAMAEQFARTDGHPVSARDLTWSYASFLTAVAARAAAFSPR